MEYYKKLKYLFSNRINLNVEGQETISFGNKGASTIEIKNLSDFLIDFIPNDYIEFYIFCFVNMCHFRRYHFPSSLFKELGDYVLTNLTHFII